MNKLPGATFLSSLHPVGVQNKTLILNTDFHTTFPYNLHLDLHETEGK